MAEDRATEARRVYESSTGKKYNKEAYNAWASSPAGAKAWKERKKQDAPAAEPKGKTYRTPDGKTYTQFGGPRSRQDVAVTAPAPAATAPRTCSCSRPAGVVAKKPASSPKPASPPEPKPTPTPEPKAPKTPEGTTAGDAATALGGRPVRGGATQGWTGEQEAERKRLEGADRAAAREKYQGPAAESIIEEGEGMGGATAAAKKRREAAAAARTADKDKQ